MPSVCLHARKFCSIYTLIKVSMFHPQPLFNKYARKHANIFCFTAVPEGPTEIRVLMCHVGYIHTEKSTLLRGAHSQKTNGTVTQHWKATGKLFHWEVVINQTNCVSLSIDHYPKLYPSGMFSEIFCSPSLMHRRSSSNMCKGTSLSSKFSSAMMLTD